MNHQQPIDGLEETHTLQAVEELQNFTLGASYVNISDKTGNCRQLDWKGWLGGAGSGMQWSVRCSLSPSMTCRLMLRAY